MILNVIGVMTSLSLFLALLIGHVTSLLTHHTDNISKTIRLIIVLYFRQFEKQETLGYCHQETNLYPSFPLQIYFQFKIHVHVGTNTSDKTVAKWLTIKTIQFFFLRSSIQWPPGNLAWQGNSLGIGLALRRGGTIGTESSYWPTVKALHQQLF